MRILHVFRSPVGGLFRHVADLSRAQNAMGHEIGLFCDSSTGGTTAETLLTQASSHLALGLQRASMGRLPSPSDWKVIAQVKAFAKSVDAEIIHGHGAKGGFYARLAAKSLRVPSVYTPHGGSLHYQWKSPNGFAFLSVEKYLARVGGGFVFVCDFERKKFDQLIGLGSKPSIVVHNGLWPEEFAPAMPKIDAKDFLFIGEVRALKGIDLLLHAIKSLEPQTRASLSVVGDGPELEDYKKLAASLGLQDRVSFEGRKTIRDAFRLGRIMIVPSRNESFPYVVLEAAAAAIPLAATAVGGIPEVLPVSNLIAKPEVPDIADKLRDMLTYETAHKASALELARKLMKPFSAVTMAEKITSFYQELSA
jgi:glycosyltransferase involved in cell wall biosynthesis